MASLTAPSAEQEALCNALSVWVSKPRTILLQHARTAHKSFFFSLDEFLSPCPRAPAGWQMYKINIYSILIAKA